jgi:alkaline phosphatase D
MIPFSGRVLTMCAANTSPFLTETWKVEGWTDGWTVAEPYTVGDRSFVLLLKTFGYAGDGMNVHIHDVLADGTLGIKRYAYKWSQGWSIAQVFHTRNGPRLFLAKALGYNSAGENIHVGEVGADGSIVADALFTAKWTLGWTTARIFTDGANQYLFMLRSSGYDVDDNNVQIRPLSANGIPGAVKFGRRWTTGWTHARFYRDNGRTFLLILKASGAASDGNNLHIDEILAGGDIAPAATHSTWIGEGWTSASTFRARARRYLAVLSQSTGAVRVYHVREDGHLGSIVNAYDRDSSYTEAYDTGSLAPDGPRRWSSGWTELEAIDFPADAYLFALKTTLTGNQEKRAKVLRVSPMQSVGPMILAQDGRHFTIQVTLACDDADYRAYVEGVERLMQRLSDDDYYTVTRAQIPQLRFNREVKYTITRDGAAFAEGTFRTTGVHKSAPFTLAFASCADLSACTRDQPAWIALAAQQPHLLVLTGDNAYPNTTMRSMIWAEHLQQRGVDSYAGALRNIAVTAVWDDHDFGPNNSAGEKETSHRQETATAFRELHTGLPYASGDAIYHKVAWQDVDLFMLDVRYFRDWYKEPTGVISTRKMLGAQQWRWLRDELAASNATFKIVVSGTTLNSGATETWADDYTREWLDLRALALATPGVIVVSGDIHKCAIQSHRLSEKRQLWEIISSGVGKGSDEHGFATVTIDATLPDPTLTARLFRKNGNERLVDRTVIALSAIS